LKIFNRVVNPFFALKR